MRSYNINFIRHGKTEANTRGAYIGVTDVHLSQNGLEQLKKIHDTIGYPRTELLISSPLSRCLETCSVIFPSQNVTVNGAFAECDFGDWEGKTAAELADNKYFAEWLSNSEKNPPPNGESGADFTRRICLGFERLVNSLLSSGTSTATIITHGGVIMTLLAVYGIPQAHSYDWRMDFGYGYAARVTPSLWMRDKIIEVYDTIPFSPKSQKENRKEDLLEKNF